MTNLERRALLGDAEAQRECSERKITLPCPLCGEQADIVVQKDAGLIICKRCKLYKPFTVVLDGVNKAREAWNRRPAPPIGRCGECTHLKDDSGVCLYCEVFNMTTPGPEAFCSAFEPKGGEENGQTVSLR